MEVWTMQGIDCVRAGHHVGGGGKCVHTFLQTFLQITLRSIRELLSAAECGDCSRMLQCVIICGRVCVHGWGADPVHMLMLITLLNGGSLISTAPPISG